MEQTDKSKRLTAISEAVRIWRKQMNLTQSKAAELTGLNLSQYQRLERGTDVNLSTFLAVAEQMLFSLSGKDTFPIMDYYSVFANVPTGLDGAIIKRIADTKTMLLK